MSKSLKDRITDKLENLLGEYVLNINRETLRLSALRGKLKLENVELDGDKIGSHFLLPMLGLSGFAVLSCQAKSLKCSVSWTQLEKEPVRMEFRGVHLLCVPLLPATSSRQVLTCDLVDQTTRLDLRTRGKRAALLRLEHDYFLGQIDSNSTEIDTLSSSMEEKPTWYSKMSEKALRNVEFTMKGVHIRCECPRGSLYSSSNLNRSMQDSNFAFGLTLDSFIVRTDLEKSQHKGFKDNSINDKSHRIMEVLKLSMYWDDDVEFLLSETALLNNKEGSNDIKLSQINMRKLQTKVSSAMEVLMESQDPGDASRQSFKNSKTSKRPSLSPIKDPPIKVIPHLYCCSPFSCQAAATFCDSDNITCLLELLPCTLSIHLQQKQYNQYSTLRNALLHQQRFDTMLLQRPTQRPSRNNRNACRAWWKYIISCVISRANSCPWRDVKRIIQCRSIYIDLVTKKLLQRNDATGFHGGLSEKESAQLTQIESIVPIEALKAFHLLALRKHENIVLGRRQNSKSREDKRKGSISPFSKRTGSSSQNALEKQLLSPSKSSHVGNSFELSGKNTPKLKNFSPARSSVSSTKESQIRVHKISIHIFLNNDKESRSISEVSIETSGLIRSFENGEGRVIFDVQLCEVVASNETPSKFDLHKIFTIGRQEDICLSSHGRYIIPQAYSRDSQTRNSRFMKKLPKQVLCRVSLISKENDTACNIASLPATLIWNKEYIDSIAEFFSSPMSELEGRFRAQLKNAATPIAKRAHVAFLSPKSLHLSVNMAAPKIWVPASSSLRDGALFFDAGEFQMTAVKIEKEMNTDWDMIISDIQMSFVSSDALTNQEIRILDPIFVHINAQLFAEETLQAPVKKGQEAKHALSKVQITIGDIYMNLIDVEFLAEAIGRWYATTVARHENYVSRRNLSKKKPDRRFATSPKATKVVSDIQVADFIISLEAKRIEIAVESNVSSGSYIHIQKRKYLVGFHNLKSSSKSMQKRLYSEFTLEDFSIVLTENESICNETNENWRHIVTRARNVVNEHVDESVSFSLTNSYPETGVKGMLPTCQLNASQDTAPLVSITYYHDELRQVDEVEMDFEPLVICITPTSFRDFVLAFRRLIELLRIATEEIERKVHDKAHQKYDNAFSSDSTLIFKVNFKDSILLLGRVLSFLDPSQLKYVEKIPSAAAVQVVASILLMVQSVENTDGTGSKTVHLSVDEFCGSITNKFEATSRTESPPIIGPVAAEIRAMYETVNMGQIVLQNFGFDCDAIKACVAVEDVLLIGDIYSRMSGSLKIQAGTAEVKSNHEEMKKIIPRVKTHGSGIATNIQFEVQGLSLVIMYKDKQRECHSPILNFNALQTKGKFDGCISAMRGECSAVVSLNYFNRDKNDWEAVVEAWGLVLQVDEMPDELILNVVSPDRMDINITSTLLGDLAEIMLDCMKSQRNDSNTNEINLGNYQDILGSTASRKSKGNLSFFLVNKSGVSINICSMDALNLCNKEGNRDFILLDYISGVKYVQNGDRIDLSNFLNGLDVCNIEDITKPDACPTLALSIRAPELGERSIMTNLPVATSFDTNVVHKLRVKRGMFHREHVVEWCVQNQQLRPGITDVYSIDKGEDLLGNIVWSPDPGFFTDITGQGKYDKKRSNSIASDLEPTKSSPWVRPLESPEWTDLTCLMRMEREGVMLPDQDWVWCNEWTILKNKEQGKDMDSDGWEYENSFETFSKSGRAYKRGDTCRRRRWTRTRILKPKSIDDPTRSLCLVWDTKRDESMGTVTVTVRSHLSIRNNTNKSLYLFGHCINWKGDFFIGEINVSEDYCVPVQFASASHFRLAFERRNKNEQGITIDNYVFCSERFLVLPDSFNSSKVFHVTSKEQGQRSVHCCVHMNTTRGVVLMTVDPILSITNLLPCQTVIKFGEVVHGPSTSFTSGSITSRGEVELEPVQTSQITSVNPQLKPHLSIKIPGYEWSSWICIINRSTRSQSWLAPENDGLVGFSPKTDKPELETEFKSVIKLERKGGGDFLFVILSVTERHSPELRVFAQYWIVNKSGFGLRFSEGVSGLILTNVGETARRSFILSNANNTKEDSHLPGFEWAVGDAGATLFYSRKEKLSVSIESLDKDGKEPFRSSWSPPIDISNVMPKTDFVIDEEGEGGRRFELALDLTVCPSLFLRTKLITIYPRYQIYNLMEHDVCVAQYGSIGKATMIPSGSFTSFHWDESSLPTQIRLASVVKDPASSGSHLSWTYGSIELDKVGITSIRLPKEDSDLPGMSMMTSVVQAEVRPATKEQNCAVAVILRASDKSSPLFVLRNKSSFPILCCQPIGVQNIPDATATSEASTEGASKNRRINHLKRRSNDEFWWKVAPQQEINFGFEAPEKPHLIEWTIADPLTEKPAIASEMPLIDVDSMGRSTKLLTKDGHTVYSLIKAENSTKVVEFYTDHEEILSLNGKSEDEEDALVFTLKIKIEGVNISLIDLSSKLYVGREIFLLTFDNVVSEVSQHREGHQNFELMLGSLQIDNHVQAASHPVCLFCPTVDESEPFIHLSAVRRLPSGSSTYVFRYVAFRVLDIDLCLDRRTAETVAKYFEPFREAKESQMEAVKDPSSWVLNFTAEVLNNSAVVGKFSDSVRKKVTGSSFGRIYVEHMALHPIKISLTFTQEWMELNSTTEGLVIFQLIRGLASFSEAPLLFNSFFVDHVFDSPQSLYRILYSHYSSQLTKHIFGILGSLNILRPGGDFLANVGSGVRDFFYQPINGIMHSPAQFLEGLESGTQSLARGILLGISQGTANVAETVNANLTTLTDKEYIEERNAYHQALTASNGNKSTYRSLADSIYHAGASISLGVRSGAKGIVDQPKNSASEHGTMGFIQGVGKAVVGAIVKPVIGVGDATAVMMHHVAERTSEKMTVLKSPLRLRRALPLVVLADGRHKAVELSPYDDGSAMAQKIVTGNENTGNVYMGHINASGHTLIISSQCLWVVDQEFGSTWSLLWEEISHFSMISDGKGVQIAYFSPRGLKSLKLNVDTGAELAEMYRLLSMQVERMANTRTRNNSTLEHQESMLINSHIENIARLKILGGIKTKQAKHLFGSCNNSTKSRRWFNNLQSNDDVYIIEHCYMRVRQLASSSPSFFINIDEQASFLVDCWSLVYSGLNSRRRILAGFINATNEPIQVRMSRLEEGGSPCYTIPSSEFDYEKQILNPGGAVFFFGWSIAPSLNQTGNVYMRVETNAFVANFSGRKFRPADAIPLPGCQVKFLEKSYDEAGWWAKYWLLITQP